MFDAIDLGELDAILGLHIRRVHGTIQRHFGDRYGDLGLTQKQVSVLWLVGSHPGIAQTDLARVLDMDRATTMTLVHALEKRALLSRAPSASDGRRIAFQLTEDGQALLTRAKSAVREHEEWLTSRFSAHELKQLRTLLGKIYR